MLKWDKITVNLNGKAIGHPAQAVKVLEALAVKKGDRVKMEGPGRLASVYDDRPFYYVSDFLYTWAHVGVKLDVFEGGRKLNAHIVEYSDFYVNGEAVKTCDDAVWAVDGRRVGHGLEFRRWISKEIERPEAVVILLGARPGGVPVEVMGGRTLNWMAENVFNGKLRVWHVSSSKRYGPSGDPVQ